MWIVIVDGAFSVGKLRFLRKLLESSQTQLNNYGVHREGGHKAKQES